VRLFRCLLCPTSVNFRQGFCSVCLGNITRSLEPRVVMESEELNGKALLSYGLYRGALADLVTFAKSQPAGVFPRVLSNFLEQLASHWSDEILSTGARRVTSVPGDPWRRLHGCDLAAHVALSVAKATTLPATLPLLRRDWNPPWKAPQKALTRAERLDRESEISARTRLVVDSPPRSDEPLLLVDDVCSTGSTLRASIDSLERRGYRVAAVLVLARNPLRSFASIG